MSITINKVEAKEPNPNNNTKEQIALLFNLLKNANQEPCLVPVFDLFKSVLKKLPVSDSKFTSSFTNHELYQYTLPVTVDQVQYQVNFNVSNIIQNMQNNSFDTTIYHIKDIKENLIFTLDPAGGKSTDTSTILGLTVYHPTSTSKKGFLVVDGNHRLSRCYNENEFDDMKLTVIESSSLTLSCFDDLYSFYLFSLINCVKLPTEKDQIKKEIVQYRKSFDYIFANMKTYK